MKLTYSFDSSGNYEDGFLDSHLLSSTEQKVFSDFLNGIVSDVPSSKSREIQQIQQQPSSSKMSGLGKERLFDY